MNIPVEYVIDKRGKPKRVVLKFSEYKKLIKLIEDLQDSLELKERIEDKGSFITHQQLKSFLKRKSIALLF